MKTKLTIIAFSVIMLTACSKDSPTTITTITTTPPIVKTPEELLTQKTWKADEIRSQLSNNTTQYYKRGGSSNNVNYDSDSLKFNINYTGTYYYSGIPIAITWNFINSEKSKMTIIINYPSPLTINWEYFNIAESSLKYTQYASAGGISYLASGTRVPN